MLEPSKLVLAFCLISSAYMGCCMVLSNFIESLKDDIFIFKSRRPVTILLFILFGPGYGVIMFGILIVAFFTVVAFETFDLVNSLVKG